MRRGTGLEMWRRGTTYLPCCGLQVFFARELRALRDSTATTVEADPVLWFSENWWSQNGLIGPGNCSWDGCVLRAVTIDSQNHVVFSWNFPEKFPFLPCFYHFHPFSICGRSENSSAREQRKRKSGWSSGQAVRRTGSHHKGDGMAMASYRHNIGIMWAPMSLNFCSETIERLGNVALSQPKITPESIQETVSQTVLQAWKWQKTWWIFAECFFDFSTLQIHAISRRPCENSGQRWKRLSGIWPAKWYQHS